MEAFKKIAAYIFPSYAKQEKRYNNFQKCITYLNGLIHAEDEKEIFTWQNNYNNFVDTLTTEEKSDNEMRDALDSVNILFETTIAYITRPLEYVEQLQKVIESMQGNNAKPENVADVAENCACASLIAVATQNLSEEEKQKQFIIQQQCLNISVNHSNSSTVHYWYGVHFALRGDMVASKASIEKMVPQLNVDNYELVSNPKSYAWMKKNFPTQFNEMVTDTYREWVMTLHDKAQNMKNKIA